MKIDFEIRTLRPFTNEEIWPLLSGYETREIYAVEKSETDERTVFDFRLTKLETPFYESFYQDFEPEDCEWYLRLIPKGACFGAYQGERLIGAAIGEMLPEEHLLRVWEFHVMEEFQRMGIGRALMEQLIETARGAGMPTLMLETQNTNVHAVRFYRRMGFTVESIDLSPPHYINTLGVSTGQTAFYMKLRLEK